MGQEKGTKTTRRKVARKLRLQAIKLQDFVIPAQAGIQRCKMREQYYYVYILASQRNGTLYIGVTNDLVKRVYEHRNGLVEGFTKTHQVKRLVYYEMTKDVINAIVREKRLKKWNRKWKLKLIEAFNPQWYDLYKELIGNLDPRQQHSGMTNR